MINVEMHGRLGNQLFQYATARSLQEKTHQPMQFSFRTVNTEKDKEGNTGWEDSLKLFRVKEYKTYVGNKSVLFLDTSIFQKLIGLLYYSFYILLNQPFSLSFPLYFNLILFYYNLFYFENTFITSRESFQS